MNFIHNWTKERVGIGDNELEELDSLITRIFVFGNELHARNTERQLAQGS